jgi:hypothetical protein
MAMYEQFTERARKVMKLANQEAQRLNHEYIGTEHILLGLVKEGSGVAIQVLANLTIDPQRIVIEIERLIQKGASTTDIGPYPRTPRAKKIIEYAMEESRNLKHGHVGTEHVLLGLLREDMGVAGVILANLGLRIETLRREIENVLGEPHDWGRKPSLPQTQWAQSEKSTAELPKTCPKCGQPVVRVIWRWVHLFGNNLEDVTAGRAILASPVDKGGPPWVCLQCAPKWSEVHRMALREHELQIEKENAIVATDFEKAAQSRDLQAKVRRRLILLLDELSRDQ